MMKKILLSAIILLSAVFCINAQNESTIIFKDNTRLKGYIAEQTPGKKIVFMVNDTVRHYIEWKNVHYIKNDVPAANLLSGIRDVVTLKTDDECIRGFITETYPGDFIRMDNDASYPYTNIKSIKKEKINENQSYSEQSCYIDKIILKDGREFAGFIICQEIGKSITMLLDDNKEKEFAVKEILTFKKEKNEGYSPIYDVVLEKGKIVMSDKKNAVKFQKLEPVNNIYFIDTKGSMIQTSAGQAVTIYANFGNNNSNVFVVKAIHKSEKDGLFSKKVINYETFTDNDFFNSLPVDKSAVSKAGTTTIKFTPTEKGYYVMKVSGCDGFIVIHVK